jgi:hypothetical protein
VYRPDLVRHQVEAMLKGKERNVQSRVKMEDRMALRPKARRIEIPVIPAEMGTVLQNGEALNSFFANDAALGNAMETYTCS